MSITKTWDEPSTIGSTGVDPVLITAILIRTLRHCYSDRSRIANPALRDNVWTKDPDSRITIEHVWRWTPNIAGNRPALLIRRDEYRTIRLGIGDRYQFGPAPETRGVPADRIEALNVESYGKADVGSHTVLCVDTDGGSAEYLAQETRAMLLAISPILVQDFGLYRFEVAGLGPAQQIAESRDHLAVPIVCTIALHLRYSVMLQAHTLKSVLLESNAVPYGET